MAHCLRTHVKLRVSLATLVLGDASLLRSVRRRHVALGCSATSGSAHAQPPATPCLFATWLTLLCTCTHCASAPFKADNALDCVRISRWANLGTSGLCSAGALIRRWVRRESQVPWASQGCQDEMRRKVCEATQSGSPNRDTIRQRGAARSLLPSRIECDWAGILRSAPPRERAASAHVLLCRAQARLSRARRGRRDRLASRAMPASLGRTGTQVSMGNQVDRGRLGSQGRPGRTARMGGLARNGIPGHDGKRGPLGNPGQDGELSFIRGAHPSLQEQLILIRPVLESRAWLLACRSARAARRSRHGWQPRHVPACRSLARICARAVARFCV